MLIVGSKALKFHYPDFPRKVSDIDVIGFTNDIDYLVELLQPCEIKKSEHTVLLKNIQNKTDIFDTDNVEVLLADNSTSLKMYLDYDRINLFASKEVIFSLKKSHINFPIKFKKHIHDYCFLYEQLWGEDKLSEITLINYKETEFRLGKLKTPSLNKSVDNFFGQSKDYVKSYFIHDEIHKVMAHYDRPLFEKMIVEKTSALCDKKLWRIFPYEHKCQCVLEEAYVIALERKILPMIFGGGKGYTSDEAFDWALMRICTTLCSGWFREFATNNYFIIKMLYNKNYVEKFLESYEKGNITRQSPTSN
jgi:hypothetical protein